MEEILTTGMTLKSRNCLYSGRSVGTGWCSISSFSLLRDVYRYLRAKILSGSAPGYTHIVSLRVLINQYVHLWIIIYKNTLWGMQWVNARDVTKLRTY